MKIEEAIKHCEEKAEELRQQAEHEKQNQLNKVKMFNGHFPADYTKANSCLECAKEHEQLAEWLKDYKRLLEERPQGEWIWQTDFDGFTYWKCSNCNKKNEMQLFNFCPNCGADMRGEEE